MIRLPFEEEEALVLQALARGGAQRTREIDTAIRPAISNRDDWVSIYVPDILKRLVRYGQVVKFKDPRWVREHCYRLVADQPEPKPLVPDPVILAVPKGCICPPTSELTCQRWDCGRKSAVLGSAA